MAETLPTKKSVRARQGLWTATPEDPSHLGCWQIGPVVAEGCTARIHTAGPRDVPEGEAAAYLLKRLRDDVACRSGAVDQFRREAIVGGTLAHPNLVSVLAAQVESPPYYLVMPRLAGVSLRRRLLSLGIPALPVALWIVRQVAEALDCLFERGWRHGDIKPDNVIVSPRGHVTLIDLGTLQPLDAKRAQPERIAVGTPLYAAPEVFGPALWPDIRSDVYSLGVMLFELLSGCRPFESESPAELYQMHRQAAPPRLTMFAPHVPGKVTGLVKRMISKDPWRRPQTPSELATELIELEISTFGKRATQGPSPMEPHQKAACLRACDKRSQAVKGRFS